MLATWDWMLGNEQQLKASITESIISFLHFTPVMKKKSVNKIENHERHTSMDTWNGGRQTQQMLLFLLVSVFSSIRHSVVFVPSCREASWGRIAASNTGQHWGLHVNWAFLISYPLVTRHALHSILESFKINHPNDKIDVEIRDNQMRDKDQTPFCFFKQQGVVDPGENGTLQKEDFMFVIMTPLQKWLLQSSRIGSDSAHGTVGYGLQLSTNREAECLAPSA